MSGLGARFVDAHGVDRHIVRAAIVDNRRRVVGETELQTMMVEFTGLEG